MNKKYNSRTWLNAQSSHFTGSLVCHDGVVSNQGRPAERYTFVELSDCHGKARIHLDKNFGMQEYMTKLKLMQQELSNFINHLETYEKQTIITDEQEVFEDTFICTGVTHESSVN